MTHRGMDGYASGSPHPIFPQNLHEEFKHRFIAEKLARYAKVNDMYLLVLQSDQSIGMHSYKSALYLPESKSLSLHDILSYNSHETLSPQLLEKILFKKFFSRYTT